MELRLTLEGGAGLGRRLTKWSGGDRCYSGGFLLRIMPPSWQPVPACASNGHSAGEPLSLRPRQSCRRAVQYCDNGLPQAELLFFETTKIRIGRAPLRQILLQAELLFFEATKIGIGRGTVAATTAAGGPFYFAAKKIRIGRGPLLRRGQVPLRRLFT